MHDCDCGEKEDVHFQKETTCESLAKKRKENGKILTSYISYFYGPEKGD